MLRQLRLSALGEPDRQTSPYGKESDSHQDGRRLFAAAGVLHMVGDTPLQKFLAQRGFTVERVPLDTR